MSVPIIQLHSPIELLVTHPALVVVPGMALGEVAALMLSEGVSAVLVATEPMGIITERDMVAALTVEQPSAAAAAEVANAVTVAVSADTDIVDAATVMLQRGLRHVVVRLGDEAHAIASLQEVAVALVQAVRPNRWTRSLTLSVDVHDMSQPTPWG